MLSHVLKLQDIDLCAEKYEKEPVLKFFSDILVVFWCHTTVAPTTKPIHTGDKLHLATSLEGLAGHGHRDTPPVSTPHGTPGHTSSVHTSRDTGTHLYCPHLGSP